MMQNILDGNAKIIVSPLKHGSQLLGCTSYLIVHPTVILLQHADGLLPANL